MLRQLTVDHTDPTSTRQGHEPVTLSCEDGQELADDGHSVQFRQNLLLLDGDFREPPFGADLTRRVQHLESLEVVSGFEQSFKIFDRGRRSFISEALFPDLQRRQNKIDVFVVFRTRSNQLAEPVHHGRVLRLAEVRGQALQQRLHLAENET